MNKHIEEQIEEIKTILDFLTIEKDEYKIVTSNGTEVPLENGGQGETQVQYHIGGKDAVISLLTNLLKQQEQEIREGYEKKIRVLGVEANKAKRYGGNVSNIEGQIRGIKWALSKIYLKQEEDK